MFYRGHLVEYRSEYVKRVLAVYGVTLITSAIVLLLMGKLPLVEEPAVSIKRVVIVSFAGSFAATVVDSLD